MADIPQTFAEWSSNSTIPILARAVINTLIEDRPLLGLVPMKPWPGGEDYGWTLNKTTPTFTWESETATHESTQAIRRKLRAYLSYGHGDVEIPIHSNSVYDAVRSMEMSDAADLIRAAGISISQELWTGTYMDETNDVTIYGTGIAATPGIDAVTAIAANLSTGMAGIQYVHASTSLRFRAPGSTTYGALVDISGGDGDFTLYDGLDTTQFVTVTVDVSDFTTGAVDLDLPGALLFGLPTKIAGLKELAALDSNQVKTPSTNGDAATLPMLDELEELVKGPKGEKIFVVNNRTRIALKHLIAAVGGMKQGEFQGRDLSKYDLNYEGVPIVADSNIAINETQGSAIGITTRMYCVRLNPEVGYHLFYGAHAGPNEGTMTAVSDHDSAADSDPSGIQLPVYMRRLGESENKQTFKWRISAAISAVLKRSSSLSMRYGVTT
jgi:hypothetical protein